MVNFSVRIYYYKLIHIKTSHFDSDVTQSQKNYTKDLYKDKDFSLLYVTESHSSMRSERVVVI